MKRLVSSLLLLLFALTASIAAAQPSDLFISEYIEGSGYNKAIELYNGTGASVDLSVYTLELYSNGASTASRSTTLSGTLASGDVYVLAHTSADAAIQAEADVLDGSVINFNGDDAVVLRRDGAVVDAFGEVGVDPGSAWGSGSTSTQNNTLRRLASDCTGDTDAGDAFDPAVSFEGFGNDVFDGFGAHTATCSGGGGNTPPQFTAELADQAAAPGATLTFTYEATDVDGDLLTFALDEGPAGATLDAATGAFEWTPSAAQEGQTFTVAVSVSDGEASEVTTASLTVESPGTSTAELLISEYVEGSSYNKAIELYNAGASAIDLSAYTLERYSNGSSSAGSSLTLSGTLGAGGVYLIAHTSADAAIQAEADVLDGGVTNFNGDDAIVLRKDEAVVDVIGQVGVDPGSAWGSGSTSTQNNTLRRLASACTGDTDAGDMFDPAVSFEGFGNDAFDGLGAHTATCSGDGGGDNEAPLFTTTLPDTLVSDGTTLAFTFTASDADGDALAYDLATTAPAGAQIDASGTLTWTTDAPGVYPLTVTVDDGAATTFATAYVGVQGTLFAGEEGAALRESLRDAYTPAQTLGYDVARDTMYGTIDRDADGLVTGVYSGFSVFLPEGVDPSTYLYDGNSDRSINAEHTWPQSMGAGDEPGRSDMHHLFPSKSNVNSARSNKPFAEIPDAQTEAWYRLGDSQSTIPETDIDLYSESVSGYFEPRELHKGNTARAALYFFTIYEAVADESFLLEQRQTFVDWNALDPVDGAEVGRTGGIAARQGNVNPFLIDPTLAERAVADIAPPPPPEPITIAEARAETDGTVVTIEGVVTRAGGRFTRLQDATAGLTTFQSNGALRSAVEAGDVVVGDLLRVTGTMDIFNGLRQISPSSFEVVSENNALPAPQTVTLAELAANGEAYESELIRVIGLEIDPAGAAVFQAAATYAVNDAATAAGTVDLRTPSEGEGEIVGEAIPSSYFTFVGVLGEFRGTYQLQVIDSSDVRVDPDFDGDGDGVSDEDELACGSDPADAASVPFLQLPVDADVTFRTTGVWGTGYNAEVAITNTGDTAIRGWSVTFDHAATITNLWNGKLVSDEAVRTVTDAGHNAVIAPGRTVTFGFQAQASEVTEPSSFALNEVVDCRSVPDVTVAFVAKNVWGSGYNAELQLTNTGETPVRGWSVSFEHAAPITSLWNGQLTSDGTARTVTDAGHNAIVAPGQTVTVGYQVQASAFEEPTEVEFAFGTIGPLTASSTMAAAKRAPASTALDAEEVPAEFALSPAYPNPFNAQAHVTLTVDADQPVRVEVFNVLGQRVALLHEGPLAAGRRHTFTLDGTALSSGTYVVRAAGTHFTQQQVMMLIK